VRFEWNGRKAAANLRKHGVSFDEAASVFFDPLSTAENGEAIRIITAREATRAERKIYEEG
jgi:uncharacterized DUF497 family protein